MRLESRSPSDRNADRHRSEYASAAIALLADRGLFVFSYSQILAELCNIGLISRADIEGLLNLRCLKASHRAGWICHVPQFDDVRKLIDTVSRCFRLGVHATLQSPDDIMLTALSQPISGSHWYRDSRTLELAVQGLTPKKLGNSEFAAEKHALLRILRNSTDYGGFMKSYSGAIWQRFNSLVSAAAA